MDFKLPIPSEIAGVKIPSVTLGDLSNTSKLEQLAAKTAVDAGAHAAGMDGVVDQAEQVYKILGAGCDRVKGSCSALVAAADSITNIQGEMGPLMPLLRAQEDPVAALAAFENLN